MGLYGVACFDVKGVSFAVGASFLRFFVPLPEALFGVAFVASGVCVGVFLYTTFFGDVGY